MVSTSESREHVPFHDWFQSLTSNWTSENGSNCIWSCDIGNRVLLFKHLTTIRYRLILALAACRADDWNRSSFSWDDIWAKRHKPNALLCVSFFSLFIEGKIKSYDLRARQLMTNGLLRLCISIHSLCKRQTINIHDALLLLNFIYIFSFKMRVSTQSLSKVVFFFS